MTELSACPACGTPRPANRAGDDPWCCSIACYRSFHRLDQPEPASPSCHDAVTTALPGRAPVHPGPGAALRGRLGEPMKPTAAVTLRNETGGTTCAAPGCTNPVTQQALGRLVRYCSPACRVRAHRQRRAAPGPCSVEVDMGSASSRGRSPDRAWLVRIRRSDRSVVVAIGLRRRDADRLAEALTDLFNDAPEAGAATE